APLYLPLSTPPPSPTRRSSDLGALPRATRPVPDGDDLLPDRRRHGHLRVPPDPVPPVRLERVLVVERHLRVLLRALRHPRPGDRSEERRVGKEGGGVWSRGSWW